MYVGYGGFRWPVAHYASNNASAHQLYHTFWEIVKELYEYGFTVEYCMFDGAIANRNFMKIMVNHDPRSYRFCCRNPYYKEQKVPFVQDIKHCIKKIRNSLCSSFIKSGSKRCITLDGTPIFVAAVHRCL